MIATTLQGRSVALFEGRTLQQIERTSPDLPFVNEKCGNTGFHQNHIGDGRVFQPQNRVPEMCVLRSQKDTAENRLVEILLLPSREFARYKRAHEF